MVLHEPVLVTLESGDRLSRTEFHRRFSLLPRIKKAELVQGVVYVPSPARWDSHGEPQAVMSTWAGNYALSNPGVRVGTDVTVMLSAHDEVMPDFVLLRVPPPPGEARLTADDYVEGAPPLVGEIAASSVSYDLHDKKESYRRAGVKEYVVWRVLDNAFDWFRLVDGAYVAVAPDASGIIESAVFPGLRLNVAKLLAKDFAGALGIAPSTEEKATP